MTREFRRITYRPGAALGMVVETQREGPATAVSAIQFYRSLFNLRINATAIFTMLPSAQDMPEAELRRLEHELASCYWDDLGALVIPLRVQRLICALVHRDSENTWLPRISASARAVMETATIEQAADVHAEERLSWLMSGARGEFPPIHAAAGEFFSDYLYLQRAIVEDMRAAEASMEEGSRIPYLRRLEDEGGFVFEQVFQEVMSAERLAGDIPTEHRRMVESYMAKRRGTDDSGLLESLGLTGSLF